MNKNKGRRDNKKKKALLTIKEKRAEKRLRKEFRNINSDGKWVQERS